MKPYTILEEKQIPYFDHGKKLSTTVKNSSARRGMSPLAFAWRKFRNIVLYRLSYLCPFNGLRIKMHRKRGITIGENVYIGQMCNLDNAYPEYIYIEDNVSLAGEVSVIAHSNPYPHFANIIESRVAPIVIKQGAWVGVKATILLGVTIGENAIVAAGTVVDKNVPACTLVKGNPMKKISNFETLI